VPQGRHLRDYFHETRELMKMRARKEVVFALSPVLRERVSWDINKRWIIFIDFFAKGEKYATAIRNSGSCHGTVPLC
jgi:hypothetical protein